MDLKEYLYFIARPDVLNKTILKAMQSILADVDDKFTSDLITRILSEGYVEQPVNYQFYDYHQIILDVSEIEIIIQNLTSIKSSLASDSTAFNECTLYITLLQRCIDEKPQSYHEYWEKPPRFNLTHYSLTEFQCFLFGRDIVEGDEREELWYLDHRLEIEGGFEHITNLYIQMFGHAGQLLNLFSKSQLEKGLWMIMNSGLKGYTAYDLVWENKIDIGLKEKLIYSMFDLYLTLFTVEPFNHICHMWWDSLGYRFYRIINPVENSEYQRLQHVMFVTLQKILQLDSVDCQFAALHGLGHVRHPENEGVIQAYIKQHQQTLTADEIAYAEACIRGDIM